MCKKINIYLSLISPPLLPRIPNLFVGRCLTLEVNDTLKSTYREVLEIELSIKENVSDRVAIEVRVHAEGQVWGCEYATSYNLQQHLA